MVVVVQCFFFLCPQLVAGSMFLDSEGAMLLVQMQTTIFFGSGLVA
jgi:hypothetical protein